MKFMTNNSPQYPLNIEYNDKYTREAVNTIFLGLQIYNQLNWEKPYGSVGSEGK
jgi:hypothetical protein